jgi:hypothetical protein
MKKSEIRRTIMSAIIMLTASTSVMAVDFTAGGLNYNKLGDGKSVEIVKNSTKCTGAVTIPGTVSDGSTEYAVTTIGASAFRACVDMTELTIGPNVTTIDKTAFALCVGLKSVSVDPANKDFAAAEGALYSKDMTKLVLVPGATVGKFKIKAGVKDISDAAFSSCTKLTAFDAEPEGTYATIDGAILDKALTTVVRVPMGRAGLYIVPTTVTNMGYGAMDNCSKITELRLPVGLKKIEGKAFQACTGLTSVTIPDGVTEIEDMAFALCNTLTEVKLPAKLKTLGASTFSRCDGLKTITIPDSTEQIGTFAFSRCSGLTSAKLGSKLSTIGDGTFEKCTSLTSITMSSTVTNIGDQAFRDCTGLKFVIIPANATKIGSGAFMGCTSLTDVYANGETPAELGEQAFDGVPNTVTLSVPEGSKDKYAGAAGWGTFTNITEE